MKALISRETGEPKSVLTPEVIPTASLAAGEAQISTDLEVYTWPAFGLPCTSIKVHLKLRGPRQRNRRTRFPKIRSQAQTFSLPCPRK